MARSRLFSTLDPLLWLTAGCRNRSAKADANPQKGSGDISFNTFNTSSIVSAHDVYYPNPNAWHSIKAEIRDENGKDVSINFYLDGKLQATQYGPDYVGKALYFIINLQMEGSSGSPGPRGSKLFFLADLML